MSGHAGDLVVPNAMRIAMIGLFAMGQRCRSRSGQDRTVAVEARRFVGALSLRFAWRDRAYRAARKGLSRSLLTCPELLVWSPLLSANGSRTAAHARRMPICFDSAARQRQAPAFQMMPCLAPPADNHRLSGPSLSAFARGIEPMAQNLIGVVVLTVLPFQRLDPTPAPRSSRRRACHFLFRLA